jgi:chromosome segregation ATPase
MSFLKRNVNLGLLFLIIIVSASFVSMGLYYNENYGTLANNYNIKLEHLQSVTENLTSAKARIDQTTSVLKIKEEDETELNKRYNELRDENEDLKQRNAGLDADLKEKTSELSTKTSDLADAKTRIAVLEEEIVKLERDKFILNDQLDDLEDLLDSLGVDY